VHIIKLVNKYWPDDGLVRPKPVAIIWNNKSITYSWQAEYIYYFSFILFYFLTSYHLSLYVLKACLFSLNSGRRQHTKSFAVLLTVLHLNIFISVINQLDAHNFCFTISLFHASTCFEHYCVHHQEVRIVLHSLWYHHNYSCDDNRGDIHTVVPPGDGPRYVLEICKVWWYILRLNCAWSSIFFTQSAWILSFYAYHTSCSFNGVIIPIKRDREDRLRKILVTSTARRCSPFNTKTTAILFQTNGRILNYTHHRAVQMFRNNVEACNVISQLESMKNHGPIFKITVT